MLLHRLAAEAARRGAANQPLALLLFAAALAGCQSGQYSYYISPRVTGRVLDAGTRQPLKNVVVRRMVANTDPNYDTSRKGGMIMEQGNPAVSEADGRFVLNAERDLGLFAHAGWWSVTISFNAYGYERFQTNFTLANSTNTLEGEPLVEAGDILLRPSPR